MKKKTVHIISHSHLDREWYMPFEEHRYNTVRLIDDIMNQKEKDSNFKSFFLDGQVIPIHDYLEIRPQEKKRLLDHIKKGIIEVGPWYILQDCYLTSAEANVRNMQIGMALTKELGVDPVMIGYFPDTFGNISQAPQIVKKFGIDVAAFGRGLNEVGFDNKIVKQHGINQSELIWKSPDGSEVAAIFFANWYCNACDIPLTNDDDVVEFFKGVIKKMEKFSSIDDLLALNGCDHLPLRKDIGSIVKLLNERLPEYNFVHSNFKDYTKIVLENKDKFKDRIVTGSIKGQYTSGYHLLVSTASTRIDIKKLNYQAQNRLEREAEPISALNYLFGGNYDEDDLTYAWKLVLQNHAHDSICACSIDEVNSEVVTRFKKSHALSKKVRDEAFLELSKKIKNKSLYDGILVVNKLPNTLTTNAYVDVSFPVKDKVEDIEVIDSSGNIVPSRYKVKRNFFTLRIPKDSFRKVSFEDHFEIDFLVKDIPALGYETFYVRPIPKKEHKPVKDSKILENQYLKLTFNQDGTFNLFDKTSEKLLQNLNYFEYTCDIGEEYNYLQSECGTRIYSKGTKAQIKKTVSDDVMEVMNIKLEMTVPKERNDKVASSETTKLPLDMDVILYRNQRHPIVKLRIDNNVKDYRLRAIFNTHIKTEHVYSEGQFDLEKNDIHPWSGWVNPNKLQRFDNFVMLKDKENMFLVSSKGLQEYEVIRHDSKNPLALTLLRCVREMGDFGFFPTPDAQMQGLQEVEYIVSYGDAKNELNHINDAYKFKARRLYGYQIKANNEGYLPDKFFFLENANKYIQMSAFKKAFRKEGLVVRFYSISEKKESVNLKLNKDYIKKVYLTNLNEEIEKELLITKDGFVKVDFNPKEIITLLLDVKKEDKK